MREKTAYLSDIFVWAIHLYGSYLENKPIFNQIYYCEIIFGGACGVMVIVEGNGHGEPSSNQGRSCCISQCVNTLGKDLSPAKGR